MEACAVARAEEGEEEEQKRGGSGAERRNKHGNYVVALCE